MTEPQKPLLVKLGLRYFISGPSSAQIMMLNTPRALFSRTSADAELKWGGKKPHGILVRGKKLAEQPIRSNPELNGGVRLNIRPFTRAEAPRHYKEPELNITWDNDRGNDVERAAWLEVFKGDRINDPYLTLTEKRAAHNARGQGA